MDINKILDEARRLGCSDLHFTAGLPPVVRLHGSIKKLSGYPDCTEPIIVNIINQITSMKHKASIQKGLDTDFSYVSASGHRHRVNVYRQRGYHAIAMRLLRNDIPTLQDLMLPGLMGEFALRPRGLVLVTGPTGSGKSTTLYAALGEISKPNNNVITVEDPVEKKIDGVNQCQINEKAGMTFGAALRSILRQDPDIIMIGEIRDRETAAIAVQASITGHLVVSTLHTNNAVGTLNRMADMGVERYLIADSVVGVIAQRLVRKLCSHCKKMRPATSEEKRVLRMNTQEDVNVYEPCGCDFCSHTGYYGRIGVFEIMEVNDEIRDLIAENGTTEELERAARNSGMRTLRENGINYVLNGTTSVEEMLKASYE